MNFSRTSLVLMSVFLLCCMVSADAAERTIVRFERPHYLSLQAESRTKVVKSLKLGLKSHLREIAEFVKPEHRPNELWAANAVVLDLTPAQIKEIKTRPGVRDVLPVDSDIRVPDTSEKPVTGTPRAIQWGVAKMQAPKVWEELKIDGSGVVVGHLDTGVAGNHPAFEGQIIRFRDFTNTSTTTVSFDDQGHGSHSAGSIAGKTDGIGVAPGAKLVVGKIFTGSGSTTTEYILSAMQWMLDPDDNPETDDAPRLVSNSWGSSSSTDTKFWDIVEAWVAAGIVPVFSAGNSGYYGASTIGTPAAYPHSFAIGATTNTDTRAAFSSRGPVVWKEGEQSVTYIKPDVSGPGNNIISAKNTGGLTNMSGTSMSCPHIAGMIALMFQANPKLGIDEVRAICGQTSVDLGTPGKDNEFGEGRVDAYKAVQAALQVGNLSDRLEATNHLVNQEVCLSGNLAQNTLSGPHVQSLIATGRTLDAGEFRALQLTINRQGTPLARKILREMEAARTFDGLQK